MNELARRKLLEIVARHGNSVIENPRRLEGLLRDYCGAYRREVSVLMMAVEEHAVLDLLASAASIPQKILLARLAQRLCDNLAISETAARWSIESWALALGVISEAEVTLEPETEKKIIAQTSGGVSTIITKPGYSNPKPTANVFIISANGSGDFTSIGEALQNAAPNSRLVVREGLYHESILLDKNIEILGDGAVEKIVVRSTNSSPIVMQTEKAKICGLTFEGRGGANGKAFFTVQIPKGELVLENCRITSDTLSGVAIFGADASPQIKKCRIYDCADSGFYIFDHARALIEDCDIYQNTNVSVAITGGAHPTLKNCRIFDGRNGGIVAWGNGAGGLVEDCRIYGHRLANIGVREYAKPIFRRCEVYNGHDTGVFVHQNGYCIFEDCDVYQNVRAEVGVSERGNSIFRRCAVYDGENSGIIVQDQGRALIENCNIFNNSDAGVEVRSAGAVIIRDSNINRNQTVAVRIKEQSAATVENCDLLGNFHGIWETEPGVQVKNINNREY